MTRWESTFIGEQTLSCARKQEERPWFGSWHREQGCVHRAVVPEHLAGKQLEQRVPMSNGRLAPYEGGDVEDEILDDALEACPETTALT